MTKRKKKFLAVFLCFLITAFCGACTGNGEKLPPDSDDKQIETPSSGDKDEGDGASSGEESGNGSETPSEDEDGDKTPSGEDNKGGNEEDNGGDKTDGTVIILPTEKF